MGYRTFTNDELADILDKHEKWLRNEEGGEQADLSNAYIDNFSWRIGKTSLLCDWNLQMANMSGSYIVADFMENTIFAFCNMTNVRIDVGKIQNISFKNTILTNTIFYISHIIGCDFRCADLSDSIFSDAYCSEIDLGGAVIDRVQGFNDICPNGTFIGYKKSGEGRIIELEIPDDAERSSAFGRKCRCSKAKVISITSVDCSESYRTAKSYFRPYRLSYENGLHTILEDPPLLYNVGEIVQPDRYDDNFWEECSNGIHFFLTREEAVKYNFT